MNYFFEKETVRDMVASCNHGFGETLQERRNISSLVHHNKLQDRVYYTTLRNDL